jgi:hypothetical protein
MAYDVTGFSDYVAREVKPLTKALFIGGDTGKFAMMQAGVKGSMKIPLVTGTTTLQAGNCPTPSGDDVITEVTITVAPFTVYKSYCQADLEDKLPNQVIGAGSHNTDQLKPWEETLVDVAVAGINQTLELTYWQGNTVSGSYQLFDGFIKLIDAGAAVNGNPTGITAITGITAANVIGIVDGMYTAAAIDVKRSEDFVILVGDDVFDLYIAAQKTANQYHYDAEHDNGVYKIGGSAATLQRVRGLAATDRLFAGRGADFIVGADVESEEQAAEVWYDKTDDKMYLRFKGKAGVVPANIDQIVEFTLV